MVLWWYNVIDTIWINHVGTMNSVSSIDFCNDTIQFYFASAYISYSLNAQPICTMRKFFFLINRIWRWRVSFRYVSCILIIHIFHHILHRQMFVCIQKERSEVIFFLLPSRYYHISVRLITYSFGWGEGGIIPEWNRKSTELSIARHTRTHTLSKLSKHRGKLDWTLEYTPYRVCTF